MSMEGRGGSLHGGSVWYSMTMEGRGGFLHGGTSDEIVSGTSCL